MPKAIVAMNLVCALIVGFALHAPANAASMVTVSGTHDRSFGFVPAGTPVSVTFGNTASLPLLFSNGVNIAAWQGNDPSEVEFGGFAFNFDEIQVAADNFGFGPVLNVFGRMTGDPLIGWRITFFPAQPSDISFSANSFSFLSLDGMAATSFALTVNSQTAFISDTPSFTVTAVPEPSTWAMFIMGFGLVGGVYRKKSLNGVRLRISL